MKPMTIGKKRWRRHQFQCRPANLPWKVDCASARPPGPATRLARTGLRSASAANGRFAVAPSKVWFGPRTLGTARAKALVALRSRSGCVKLRLAGPPGCVGPAKLRGGT